MKIQIGQVEDSVTEIIESMQKLRIACLPNASIDVEMGAVAYFDWDAGSRKLGRPVVSVFGGGGVSEEHSDTLTPERFCFGGKWTKDTAALQKSINQGPLGMGVCPP
ncbi:MAP3K2 [Symbiodinium natans]|uniref:MAP3K2 protein n=1 Tax=Symbiodinium natans TaxID=878477 RepID=A0A812R8S4_9DINO|nr:MAP3K2 [Symbiodinium natans]